jgi:hypothetical protein
MTSADVPIEAVVENNVADLHLSVATPAATDSRWFELRLGPDHSQQ